MRPFCDKNKQRAKQILILQIELVHNTSLKILILYERKVGQYKSSDGPREKLWRTYVHNLRLELKMITTQKNKLVTNLEKNESRYFNNLPIMLKNFH